MLSISSYQGTLLCRSGAHVRTSEPTPDCDHSIAKAGSNSKVLSEVPKCSITAWFLCLRLVSFRSLRDMKDAIHGLRRLEGWVVLETMYV